MVTTSIILEQSSIVKYEHPLNEKIRILLRIEFLYNQLLTSLQMNRDASCIMALHNLLAMIELNERYDLKSESIKFLDKLIVKFHKIYKQPTVDSLKLEEIISDLNSSLNNIKYLVGKLGSSLSTNEWLTTIKKKTLLPGGLSSADLPFLHYWQKFPLDQKINQLRAWMDVFSPLFEAVTKILAYTRKTANTYHVAATNGSYHKILDTHFDPLLVVVEIPRSLNVYPEISGNHSRVTIRFLETDLVHRASLHEESVDFKLAICW